MSQPTSLTGLVWTQRALNVLGLVLVVLTWVRQDDLIRAWAEGNSGARKTLASGGLEAVKAGNIPPPAFAPLAVVLFVVLVSLVWVLVAFVRLGYGWARLTLTGLLAFLAVAGVAGVRTSPPTVFVVLAVVASAVELVMLAFLWHRDTSSHMRGTWSSVEAGSTTAT